VTSEFVIVSGADSGYFPLLRDLVLSLRDKPAGAAAPIGVFDLGRVEASDDILVSREPGPAGAYAVEVKRRDGAPDAVANSGAPSA